MLTAIIKCTYVFVSIARYLDLILTKIAFPRNIFIKVTNIKFHGDRLVRDALMHATDGQTDVTKLIVALHDYVNPPNSGLLQRLV